MSETYQLLDNLNALVAGLFLLTAFDIVATRQARGCLNLFIAQSLLLAASAALLGLRWQSGHLYGVAIVNVITKPSWSRGCCAALPPAEVYTRREIDQVLNIPTSLLIALALAVLSYLAGPLLNAVAPEFRGPNVPIGIAGLLLGAFTLTVRREAVPLLIGLLVMENDAFLSSIALSRNLPLLVELAIATDGLIIVFIMGVLTRAVHKHIGRTAVGELATVDVYDTATWDLAKHVVTSGGGDGHAYLSPDGKTVEAYEPGKRAGRIRGKSAQGFRISAKELNRIVKAALEKKTCFQPAASNSVASFRLYSLHSKTCHLIFQYLP